MTPQRRVILDELRKVDTHPTADELYTAVRRRLPRTSLGTVYRNLDLLSQCGMVRRLHMAGAQTRYDGNTSPHDHVRCEVCGRVDDVAGPPCGAAAPEPSIGHFNGYKVSGYRLEFIGICPSCQV